MVRKSNPYLNYIKYTRGDMEVLILDKETREEIGAYALISNSDHRPKIVVESRDDLIDMRDAITDALKQEHTLDRKFEKADLMKGRFEDIDVV
jgi:hypothetical protein